MHIAVCDDQIDVLEQVSNLVETISPTNSVIPYNTINNLLIAVKDGILYDVVIMDIDWEDEDDGMDYAATLRELSPDTKIIFMTGFQERYAQQILLKPSNLCGFISKPIDRNLLAKYLNKADTEIRREKEKKLTVSFGGIVSAFAPENIYLLESKGHAATIHTSEGKQRCYERLEALKERLPPQFVYTHKSFLVNMDFIKRIERDRVLLLNNVEIPVSKGKYTMLKKTYFSYISSSL
ncbi:MAG: LytTR family DNA-binding domain-containing protein [Oscillospiraceae bacterium]|nr:LytTR family DNA-binding domain-containing protein [Oscillospiraceae bacterium]